MGWMIERAALVGVQQQKDEPEDDDKDAELAAMLGEEALGDDAAVGDDKDSDEEGDDGAAKKAACEPEEDSKAAGSQDKGKNYSAVNVVYKESKLPFRGVLTTVSFTNWLWWRCVRPRLEKTKAKGFADVEGEFGIDDVEEIFGQFMPKDAELPGKNKDDKDDKKSKKGDKDDDKKSKKDDKKDKKGDK